MVATKDTLQQVVRVVLEAAGVRARLGEGERKREEESKREGGREDESASGGVVWAIDPADVSTHLMPDCVRHLRVLAEDAVETVREGLKSTPSGQLRLVVCDANMHPEACVRIAVDFFNKV